MDESAGRSGRKARPRWKFGPLNPKFIFQMKLSLLLTGTLALFLAGCVKEGPQGPDGPQGPAGPAGPTGPAGEDGTGGSGLDFAVFETTVLTTDWQGSYVEFPAAIVTETVMNEGVVLVYGYFWTAASGGIVGLDHDETITPTVDYNVRVVAMSLRDYEVLDPEDLGTFESLTEALASK